MLSSHSVHFQTNEPSTAAAGCSSRLVAASVRYHHVCQAVSTVAKKAFYNAVALAGLAAVCGFTGTVQAQPAVRQTDVQAFEVQAKRLTERFRVEHAAAVAWAQQQGIAKLRIEQSDGRIVELMYMRDGRPVYYITNNANASDSSRGHGIFSRMR